MLIEGQELFMLAEGRIPYDERNFIIDHFAQFGEQFVFNASEEFPICFRYRMHVFILEYRTGVGEYRRCL